MQAQYLITVETRREADLVEEFLRSLQIDAEEDINPALLPHGEPGLPYFAADDVAEALYVCKGSIGYGYDGCAPRILDFLMDHPDYRTNMVEVAKAAGALNWQSASSTLRRFKSLAIEQGREIPWVYDDERQTHMPASVAEAFRAARDHLRSEGEWPS